MLGRLFLTEETAALVLRNCAFPVWDKRHGRIIDVDTGGGIGLRDTGQLVSARRRCPVLYPQVSLLGPSEVDFPIWHLHSSSST